MLMYHNKLQNVVDNIVRKYVLNLFILIIKTNRIKLLRSFFNYHNLSIKNDANPIETNAKPEELKETLKEEP